MCEYWLFLFSIHWNIGCSGWKLLQETCNYRNSLRLFSLFSDERHQQLAVVHHHLLNQIRKTEFSQFPPTFFAKFNLPQHRLALRSNKREAKGRSALKATAEEGDEKKEKFKRAFSGPRRVQQCRCLRVSKGIICHFWGWASLNSCLYWKFQADYYTQRF